MRSDRCEALKVILNRAHKPTIAHRFTKHRPLYSISLFGTNMQPYRRPMMAPWTKASRPWPSKANMSTNNETKIPMALWSKETAVSQKTAVPRALIHHHWQSERPWSSLATRYRASGSSFWTMRTGEDDRCCWLLAWLLGFLSVVVCLWSVGCMVVVCERCLLVIVTLFVLVGCFLLEHLRLLGLGFSQHVYSSRWKCGRTWVFTGVSALTKFARWQKLFCRNGWACSKACVCSCRTWLQAWEWDQKQPWIFVFLEENMIFVKNTQTFPDKFSENFRSPEKATHEGNSVNTTIWTASLQFEGSLLNGHVCFQKGKGQLSDCSHRARSNLP